MAPADAPGWHALQKATNDDLAWLADCHEALPCAYSLRMDVARTYEEQVQALSDMAQDRLDWYRFGGLSPAVPLEDPWVQLEELRDELESLAQG